MATHVTLSGTSCSSDALIQFDPTLDRTAVYIPGDIQDWDSLIEAEYAEWSLENTFKLLVERFPKHNIIILRAFAVNYGYADYRNLEGFLPGECIQRVSELISNACEVGGCPDAVRLPLAVVGFSKGCSVLNRIVADLASPTTFSSTSSPAVQNFLSSLRVLHWVDAGNMWSLAYPAIGEGTRALSEFIHKRCTEGVNIVLCVDGSPRQLKDRKRAWICTEKDAFIAEMQTHNVPVFDTDPALLLSEQQSLNSTENETHVGGNEDKETTTTAARMEQASGSNSYQ